MAAIFVLTALLAFSSRIPSVDGKTIIEGGNGGGGIYSGGSGNVASLGIWRERRRAGGAASPTAMSGATNAVYMERTTTMGRRRLRGYGWGHVAALHSASARGEGEGSVVDDINDDGDDRRDHPDDHRDDRYFDRRDDSFDTPSRRHGNGNDGNNDRRRGNHVARHQLQPPNIKLMPQPRKRELWLPWPLGAMRSDYYRFEADEKQRRMRQREQISRNRQNVMGRDHRHRLESGSLFSNEWQDQWERGREWATGILLRGGLASGGDARGTTDSMRRHPPVMQKEYDVDDIGETSASSSSPSTMKSNGGGAWDTAASIRNASWLPWGKGNDGGAKAMGNGKSIGRGGTDVVGGGVGIDASPDDGLDSRQDNHGAAFDRDVLLRYLRLQASVRLRQLGYVGSDFSVHLPPSSPVLLFYFLLPSRRDPMRRLVRYTLAGATLSWMHSECTKYRRFSPLPVIRGVNVRRPDLPPFLPEEDGWMDDVIGGGNENGRVIMETDSASATTATNNNMGGKQRRGEGKSDGGAAVLSPTRKAPLTGKAHAKSTTNDDDGGGLGERGEGPGGEIGDIDDQSHNNGHHLWDPFQSFGSVSSIYRTWLEGHNMRSLRSAQQRRVCASEQLLTLRKTNSTAALSSSTASPETANNADAGYALVTGASSGIGRALSVELARYRIPLILVARDLSRLTAVANDIERHYDVTVRILQADLSSPNCARRIYDATTAAGLCVDILVNNAGLCAHGDFVDGDAIDVSRMVSVNVGAVTALSQLYGRDMRERRRGRILMVSSMSGALPGNPSVAVYAATKAYEKSLASSLGREMERYGVGVTCLLPGAVKDTAIAKRSEIEEAACFHFPGYAKTPEYVAGEGIKGLMLGYPEIYPGAVNSVFIKALLPMLPSRLSTIIGELAWNPWQWGDVVPQRRSRSTHRIEEDGDVGEDDRTSHASSPTSIPWSFLRPSSRSNQMQLSTTKSSSNDSFDVPLDQRVVDFTEPVRGLILFQQNTTISDENNPGSLAVRSGDTESALILDKQDVAIKHDRHQDSKILTTRASEDNGDTTGDNDSAREDVSTSRSLVLPPASAAQPIPTPQNHDADGTVESHMYLQENTNQTWLPLPSMMDQKDYDFRDRRLDY